MDEGFEEVGGDCRVVIEEEDKISGAVLEAEVIATGEAEVGGALDDLDGVEVLEEGERVIGGVVIDDDDFAVGVGGLEEGGEAIFEPLCAIEIDDEDGDFGQVRSAGGCFVGAVGGHGVPGG